MNTGNSASLPARRPARSEQGYTMQALIISAILVLLAVGAGVLILALVSGAEEDVDDQTRYSYDDRCNPVEVYDNNAAVGFNAFNANSKVAGSRPGCIPVCFWKDEDGDGMVGADDKLRFSRMYSVEYDDSSLVFKSPAADGTITSSAGEVRALAAADRFFTTRAQGRPGATAMIKPDGTMVRADVDAEECQLS